MKSLKFKIYPREFLFTFFLIMLPLSLSLELSFPNSPIAYIAYTDEILCIVCSFYVLYSAFKRGIKGTDLALLIILLLCTAWGLVGNAVSKVITDWFPIVVDAICLLKIFVPFIIFKQVAAADKKMRIIHYLKPLSKALIALGAFFGTISQFVYIGMSLPQMERRYGIVPFFFIFGNEGRYGYIIACALLVVLMTERVKRKRIMYELLAILNIVYTTKGVAYVIAACYIILLILWYRDTKLTVPKIAVLAVGGIAVSAMQINTYLRDLESPRMTLIRYGLVTANRYFPFGSGFATYGSDMAARNYSQLYYLYGFDKLWGLSPQYQMFLNDVYLGMVFGQFGYIGVILFVIMLIMVFIPVYKLDANKKVKALTLAIFIGIVVSAIATAIIKSSIGVFVFAFLGLMCGYSGNELVVTDSDIEKEGGTRLKIRFSRY